LRGTSRCGFAGVPNALNLELCLSVCFKSLSLSLRASWCGRVVLHRSKSQSPPLPKPSFSAALGVAAALYNLLRVGVLRRIVIGGDPKPPITFTLGLAGALCDFPRCCELFVCMCAVIRILAYTPPHRATSCCCTRESSSVATLSACGA